MRIPNCGVLFELARDSYSCSKSECFGEAGAQEAGSLSRYYNNQLVQAQTVCKYPSLQDQKRTGREKGTYIILELFLGGGFYGWMMVSQLLYFSLFPFGFGKNDQLYLKKKDVLVRFSC